MLQAALKTVKKYKMTINDSKCELIFLGRRISGNDVSPLPNVVLAVQNAPTPHNKHSLSFLGLFNFYRCYIGNAAALMPTDASNRPTLQQKKNFLLCFGELRDFMSICTDDHLLCERTINIFVNC